MHAGPPRWILLYDFAAAATFGAVAGWAAWALVPTGWPLPLAMAVGMVVGTLAVVAPFVVFTLVLGGFELIVLSMSVGMLSGMAGAMSGAMAGTSSAWNAVVVGGAVGIGVQTLVRIGQARLAGEVDVGKEVPG